MISKELRTGLLLGCAIALAIPVAMLLPRIVPAVHAPAPYLIAVPGGEYDFLPMMNWCGSGDYGKLNTIVAAQKLMYDNIPGSDWYFYKVTLETVPGKVACTNSDWRTDNTYTKYIVNSPDQLVDQSPTSTNGASSVTVTLGADSGGPTFSESYTYNIQDVTVLDNSDLSAQRAEWVHDINEQGNVPASTNTYDAYPGFVVKTPENNAALVQSTPDGKTPCDANNHGCGFRVDWGKPGWCGWLCGTWYATWRTDTLYFDAQMSGDSPNPPTLNKVPNLSTNEGQQVSYQASASDPDGDPVTFSLGTGPAGSSITSGGLFTWTPPDHSEGTYLAQVIASDGYGGTASQNFYITVNEADNAQFITWTTPPATMNPGQQATVSVTMKNIGTSTWTPASSNPPYPFRLGAQNPQDNTNWGFGRVDLSSPVAPGNQYTFNFVVTAPSKPGTYNFQWRMVQEFIEWFGDYTPNFVVTVPGFTISSCGSISMATGGSTGSCSVTLSSVGGWSGTVGLSITPGVTGGPTASLNTTSVVVPAGGTGSASVNLVSGSTASTFFYTVTGTSGSRVQSTTFSVNQYTPCTSSCGGGGSIAYGSLITMADGSRVPVQNLQVGDKMLGYDTTTGTYTVSVVNSITVVDTTNQLIIQTSNGTPFRVDANPHQTLWVKTAAGIIGWVPVIQIKVGDDLWTQNGWVPVTSIEFAPAGTHVMYDIVASAPYFADGYLDPIVKT